MIETGLVGGVLIYVRDDIPSKQVTKHKLPGDIEGVFVEINLRKTKWLIFGTYRPPNQSAEYFFKQTGYALDTYNQIYETFLFAGDFNSEESEPCLSEFLSNHDFKNLVKEKTCYKSPTNPRCIDLFLTNSTGSFQDTTTVATGLSDFHKMILTVLKTTMQRVSPKEIIYRDYKHFEPNNFRSDLRKNLESINDYESFEKIVLSILNKHAPLKKKVVRANHVPYMTKALRKAIMKRSALENKYLRNNTTENKIHYKKQKNFCSRLYKIERKKFYSNLEINNIIDNKIFWKTMKPFLSDKCANSRKY